MSANWYCEIHQTSQLLSCSFCEMEENNTDHVGCRTKLQKLETERDALRAELEKWKEIEAFNLKKRMEAEAERDRYREALADIASHGCHPDCNHQEVAKAALGETK